MTAALARSGRAAARAILLTTAVLAAGGATATAAPPAPSTERYGTIEQRNLPIHMSDGTVLRANVTLPADATGAPAPGRFPVVLTETAYGKDLATSASGFSDLLGTPDFYARRGYVAVMVDVRGTGASEGVWSFNDPQEARDSVEVIRWAAALPHSDGKVGMVGASYLGITQLFAAAEIGRGSPLKAIFPMVASNSIFREAVMPGGLLDSEGVAAYLGLTGVLNLTNPLMPGDPATAVQPIVDHLAGLLDFHAGATADALLGGDRAEDGAFWRARGPERVLARVARNRIPAYLVGGFDDLFQSGVFRNYVGLQNAWAGRATTLPMSRRQRTTGRYQALVGPWFHAGIGKGGPDLRELSLRWFDRWLRGVPNGIERTRTPLHVVQRDRRARELSRWPVPRATTRPYVLAPGGGLRTDGASPGAAPLAFTAVSLPCQRSTEQWALGLGEAITDALHLPEPCADGTLQPPLPAPLTQSFTTAPTTSDTVIAGPLTASIRLASTTRDAELIAKVYDVAPSGTARELSMGGLLASQRAVDDALSWRDAAGRLIYPHHPITHAAARPLTPGRPARLDVEIPPVVHTLAAGHRLRLVLATGEFPARFPLPASLPDLLGGVYTVALGGTEPSTLNVPVL